MQFLKEIIKTIFHFIENKLIARWIIENGVINRKRENIWKSVKIDASNGFKKGYTQKIINARWKRFKLDNWDTLRKYEQEKKLAKSIFSRFIYSILLSALAVYILILVLYKNTGLKGFTITDEVVFQKAVRFMVVKEPLLKNKEEFMDILADTFIALGAGAFGLLGIMMGAIAVAVSLINKYLEDNSIGIEGFGHTIDDFSTATSLLIRNTIACIILYLFTFTQIAITISFDFIFYGLFIFFFLYFRSLLFIKKVFTSCFEGLVAGTPIETKWIQYNMLKRENSLSNNLLKRRVK